MKIELGSIYEHEIYNRSLKYIMRVLTYDQFEVLSTQYLTALGRWSDYPLTRTSVFSRESSIAFANQTRLIDILPLTKEEFSIIRPDLLIRTARIKHLSWNNEILKSINALGDYIKVNNLYILENEILDTNRIYLQPLSKNKAPKPSILIEANNGKYFTCIELLMKASALQLTVNPNKSNGVGIYRSGLRKKIPVFYIWEYFDLAGIMEEGESKLV